MITQINNQVKMRSVRYQFESKDEIWNGRDPGDGNGMAVVFGKYMTHELGMDYSATSTLRQPTPQSGEQNSVMNSRY